MCPDLCGAYAWSWFGGRRRLRRYGFAVGLGRIEGYAIANSDVAVRMLASFCAALPMTLLYYHDPTLLQPVHREEVERLIAERLTMSEVPPKKWTSLSTALQATDELLATAEGADAELLSGYRTYLVQRLLEHLGAGGAAG